ncbi:hypothetical protein BKA70DRAFT_1097100 [Coprinopsis sp. MPI-PUGE-AT-0042]|nr:hypothetical protein BKA70DRAFT_1422621 [Coprinopsis sp. MPI-PUGE-AT-0042]KAH6913416.1 hypothetical protein BKA70DRAFT_1097100 [Coprinopsis sp. MPI-PUGE-AT-0042]
MLPGDIAFDDASALGDLPLDTWQGLIDYASSRLRAAGQKLVQEHNRLTAQRIELFVGWIGREILLTMLLHSAAVVHFPQQVSSPPCLSRLVALFFNPSKERLNARMLDVACSGGEQQRDAVVGYYREDWWNRLERMPKALGMKDMLQLYQAQIHTFVRPVPEAPPINLVLSEMGREALVEARILNRDAVDVVNRELACNATTIKKITKFLQTCGYPTPSPGT